MIHHATGSPSRLLHGPACLCPPAAIPTGLKIGRGLPRKLPVLPPANPLLLRPEQAQEAGQAAHVTLFFGPAGRRRLFVQRKNKSNTVPPIAVASCLLIIPFFRPHPGQHRSSRSPEGMNSLLSSHFRGTLMYSSHEEGRPANDLCADRRRNRRSIRSLPLPSAWPTALDRIKDGRADGFPRRPLPIQFASGLARPEDVSIAGTRPLGRLKSTQNRLGIPSVRCKHPLTRFSSSLPYSHATSITAAVRRNAVSNTQKHPAPNVACIMESPLGMIGSNQQRAGLSRW